MSTIGPAFAFVFERELVALEFGPAAAVALADPGGVVNGAACGGGGDDRSAADDDDMAESYLESASNASGVGGSGGTDA
jgi:hypothetical protein